MAIETDPQETEQPHILVVDDEPGIRDLLERYLARQGYRVSIADGGAAMDDVLGREQVDLVMPGEDGLTLTRRLRESHGTAIIILTLKSHMVDRVVGLVDGRRYIDSVSGFPLTDLLEEGY